MTIRLVTVMRVMMAYFPSHSSVNALPCMQTSCLIPKKMMAHKLQLNERKGWLSRGSSCFRSSTGPMYNKQCNRSKKIHNKNRWEEGPPHPVSTLRLKAAQCLFKWDEKYHPIYSVKSERGYAIITENRGPYKHIHVYAIIRELVLLLFIA